MRISILVALVVAAGFNGCGGGDAVTQPPAPLDVSGTWHGGVTSEALMTPCATPEPASVTATFTQSGTRVTGAFSGACLDGATFEGRVQDQSLRGGTAFERRFCPGPSITAGPGSASRIQLDIQVHYGTEFTGCSGSLVATGRLRLDLAR